MNRIKVDLDKYKSVEPAHIDPDEPTDVVVYVLIIKVDGIPNVGNSCVRVAAVSSGIGLDWLRDLALSWTNKVGRDRVKIIKPNNVKCINEVLGWLKESLMCPDLIPSGHMYHEYVKMLTRALPGPLVGSLYSYDLTPQLSHLPYRLATSDGD